MRKLTLLLLLPLFMLSACSKDDDNENKGNEQEQTQDYTSFTIVNDTGVALFPNCVAGYYDKEGNCKKVAELGDLKKGIYSKEIRINDKSITEIYIFTDYISPRKLDKAFLIKNNTKNILTISSPIDGVETDKNNPKEYPQ